MKSVVIPGLLLLLLSCQNSKSGSGQRGPNMVDSAFQKISTAGTNSKETDEKTRAVVYSSDIVRVIGDTTINRKKLYYAEIKFEPFIHFDDFKTGVVYSGEKCSVGFESNTTAKRFRTVVAASYSKINFAGFYTFVSWGCGAPCQESALIDWRDGKVYDGPTASLGYDLRPDSRMLIVNPPDTNGFFPDCSYCQPQIWIWNEDNKTFGEIQPK